MLVAALFAVGPLAAQTSTGQFSFQAYNPSTGCPTGNQIAGQVLVGDFNGDKIPDLAVGCGAGNFTQLSVLLGTGNGTFRPPIISPLAAPVREDLQLVAVDVNGDGKTDLVYSAAGPSITLGNISGSSCTLTVLLSNGNGKFTASTPANHLAYCVWGSADLNADGNADLVLSGVFGAAGFGVMLGNGQGGFSALVAYGQNTTEQPQAIGDFNGDGKPDVITAPPNDNGTSIWLNQGDGTFGAANPVSTTIGGTSFAGDFNGDGKLDLGVSEFDSYFYLFLGNGDGTFQAPGPGVDTFNEQPLPIDLTGNGRLDLTSQVVLGTLEFILANADGSFQSPTDLVDFTSPPSTLSIAADLNGDGKPDIAGLAGNYATVAVLINNSGAAPTTPQTWTEQNPQSTPPSGNNNLLAYDSLHKQTVFFGGGANSQPLNQTWLWDGTNWTQQFPQTNPEPSVNYVMAFDSIRNQTVLFGGYGTSDNILNQTWTWDGTNWTLQSPANSPPARREAAMAFDSLHGQMVLFGGYSGTALLNDTWLWDGTNWTQAQPSNSPPARDNHAMAFDSAHGQTVLFEGEGNKNQLLNDTWLWDGANWTNPTLEISPPKRMNHSLAYDSAFGQTVLFGGSSYEIVFNDTWTWNGSAWTLENPPIAATARYSAGMDYDSGNNQLVLVGGLGSNDNSLSDTWTYGAAPTNAPQVSGVVSASAFGGFASVSPGGWVEIYGKNLAPSTSEWSGADFVNNTAPTALNGVKVAIGGQNAFIDYVSAGQVNALLPSTIATGGLLQLTVSNGAEASNSYGIQVNATEPGLLAPASFNIGGTQYAVAILTDGSYALPTGAIEGVNSRPAKPGEVAIFYGVGFGPVTPASPAGELVGSQNSLASSFQMSIGGTAATAQYDGLAPGYTGLYQFNIAVPETAAGSAVPVGFTLGGQAGAQKLYIAVGN